MVATDQIDWNPQIIHKSLKTRSNVSKPISGKFLNITFQSSSWVMSCVYRLDLLRWGCTEQFLNWLQNMPVEQDRLILLLIVGSRIWEHCFKTFSVRRLRKQLRNLISGNTREGWELRWSKWRTKQKYEVDSYEACESSQKNLSNDYTRGLWG